jgi:hypothetical protein
LKFVSCYVVQLVALATSSILLFGMVTESLPESKYQLFSVNNLSILALIYL